MKRTPAKTLELFSAAFLLAVTFLLPLKFGGLAAMPEASSLYLDSLFAYLVVSWPVPGFGFFSGTALLLALLAFPAGAGQFRSGAGRCAWLWGFGLAAVSLIGWIHAATVDYAVCETGHLAAVGAYVFAVYLVLSRRPEWRGLWISVLVAGTLLTGVCGLHQYFAGFEQTREFVAKQKAEGILFDPVLEIKMADTRVFATFVSCNALGGYLLLLMPVAVLTFRRWGGHFEPVRVSVWLFSLLGGGVLFWVFLLTKSRGAFLAALVVFACYVLFLPMRRLWRMLLIALAVLIVTGGAFYIHHRGRGFRSMAERADYLKTAAVMTCERPLAGHGWGGFFFRHMIEKESDSDEAAHDPHNFAASFASQTGIAGLIVVLAAVVLPLSLLGKRVLRHQAAAPEQGIFWGACAFFFHALLDIDLQIPANMAAAGGLLTAALCREPEVPPATVKMRIAFAVAPFLLTVTALGFAWHLTSAEIRFDALQKLVNGSDTVPGGMRRPASGDQVYAALMQAVEVKPYSPFPLETAAGFYLRNGDTSAAEQLLNEAEKRGGRRASIEYKRVRLELLRRNLPAARKHWKQVFELFPTASYRREMERREPELLRLLEE